MSWFGALLLSLFLLKRSLRGRLTGDHPTCSRCSFDLFNRPETSTHCPECGQDLTSPRAILPGTRRRNPAFILSSFTLVLVVLAGTTTLTYRVATDSELVPLQPTFLLPVHFRYGPLSAPALAELQFRIINNGTPASAASGVVARILSLQADPAATWNTKYGDFVEALRRFSSLPDADWTTYLQHSALVTGRIRPNVRTGDPVPFELTITARVGRIPNIRSVCSGSVTFDDQRPRRRSQWGNPWIELTTSMPFPIWHSARAEDYANLSPGPHAAHISVELAVGLPGDPPVILRQSFDFPITLHPADHPTVHVLDDPVLRDQIAHSILIAIVPSARDRSPMFSISAPSSPCALAYDVLVRSGDQDFGGSSMEIAKGSRNSSIVSPRIPPNLPAQVDLTLRPDPRPAAATVDITEISAGEITLPNIATTIRPYNRIPALRSAPATRSAP